MARIEFEGLKNRVHKFQLPKFKFELLLDTGSSIIGYIRPAELQFRYVACEWDYVGNIVSPKDNKYYKNYNLTPIKLDCKHEEVKEWFKCNKDKGVWTKGCLFNTWVLTGNPAWHKEQPYVQNDEYAEFRKAIVDGKSIELYSHHKDGEAIYSETHTIDTDCHYTKYRIKPNKEPITIKVNFDPEKIKKLAKSISDSLFKECKACVNYIDCSFENPNCTGCSKNPFYMNCFTPKPKLKVGDWVKYTDPSNTQIINKIKNIHMNNANMLGCGCCSLDKLTRWQPELGEIICHKTLGGHWLTRPYELHMKNFEGLAPKEFIQTLKDL